MRDVPLSCNSPKPSRNSLYNKFLFLKWFISHCFYFLLNQCSKFLGTLILCLLIIHLLLLLSFFFFSLTQLPHEAIFHSRSISKLEFNGISFSFNWVNLNAMRMVSHDADIQHYNSYYIQSLSGNKGQLSHTILFMPPIFQPSLGILKLEFNYV